MLINDLLERFVNLRVVRTPYPDVSEIDRKRRMRPFHREAFDAIRVMESYNGKSLTPPLKRKADEYAHDVLGDVEYAPWLYVYATMQGVFREGWMPDDFYHLVVVPRVCKGLAAATDLKSFSNVVLDTEALPDIAYFVGGVFYDRKFNVIDRAKLCEIARPFGKVFVKLDNSGKGAAIAVVKADDLLSHGFTEDCAIQRPIQQHALFEEMVPGPVATLRITTARAPDGTMARRSARLRMGRTSSQWVQSDQQVQVAVTDAVGTLDEICYAADWRAWDKHPDTGFVFKGVRVPQFEKAVRFCLGLHQRVPHLPTIGWDLAINKDDGVELIEWNGGHCGIKFCEAVSGPHYRDMGWERFAPVAS